MADDTQRAEELFYAGYNCAQSVFCAFEEQTGIPRAQGARLSSSFGGGMGRLREVCGAVSGALSLHTASKLREEHFSAQYFGKKVPAFLYDSALSPADIGTATHKFLQYCDFAKQPCDIAAEIERLVSLSLLSGQEGRSVNQEAINRFFGSQLFARIMRAEKVYKEHSFTIAKSVCDFDPALPKRFADEKTVVIGKIDLVFIENGKAVIVDYKTDRIGEIGELPPRYADQLKVYCEAVEQALGYEAAEKILYSLTLCDFIAC